MELLPPKNFSTIAEYFQSFYKINKEKNPVFSYQYFSKHTGWPNSLLNDLINKRRSLSIARVIQFSSATKMNSFDTEYLLHLLMKESKEDHVREYYKNSIEKKYNANHYKTLEVEDDVFEDIDYIIIHELLVWANKRLPGERVCELLKLNTSLTPEKVEQVYKKLEEVGAVKFNNEKVEILAHNLFLSQNGNRNFKDVKVSYLNQTKEFVLNSYPPGLLNFVHLELPSESIDDIIDRMTMLRNWIMESSLEARDRKKNGEQVETSIFQIDLNLFPLIDKKDI